MTTKCLGRLLTALCLVFSGWQARSEEPDEFLPWVESTGTLYVDSGVIGGIGTKVRANMTWTYVGADACMLGSRVDTGNTRFWLLYVDRATWHMFLAAGAYKRLDDVTIKDGERHTFLADASTMTMTLAVDDTTSKYTYAASSEYSTGLNMFIFACNKGGVAQNFSKARLFDMKIWQNGELKRDLRPCVKNGRAGLYDSVSQTILYPAGGELRYPSFPDATLDYIESTGSQWIDTGVKGQAGVSGEGDFAYTQFGGEQTLLGVYNGPNRNQDFVAFDYDGTGTWSTYGNGWGWATGNNGRAPKGLRAGTLTANTRYRMSFDYQQDSQKVSFVDETGSEKSDSRKSEFESVDTQLNLYLFAADSNGTANYFSKAECYYVNLYVDGALVRQFVPCVTEGQDGDSADALYDKVDGKIYKFGEAAVAGTPAVVYDYSSSKTVDQMPHPLVSNGSSQYIDTGVVGKTGVRAELGVRWLVAGDTDHAMLATRNTTKNLHYNMLTVDKTGLYARCGTTGLRVPRGGLDGERAPGTDFHKYDISFSTTGRKYVFDGTVAFDTNLAVDSGELYLFARNRIDTQSAVLLAHARCYGLKFWKRSEDGETKTLLRDFIPCEKGGRAMLFDKSEGVMYPPASGTLVAGGGRKEITFEEVKYIESGVDQYVDTGIIGRQGTTAEMVMEWASPLGTTDYAYLGSRGYEITNQRISMLVICYKDVWLGYGKSQRILNDAFSPDTRYRLVTDYQNGRHTHTRNGVVKYDGCIQEGDMDTGYPMYLFGLNWGGRFRYPSHARCYSLKISQDGRVVRDYRPVLTSLGLATLYDAANDRLVPLATGPFMTYGDLKGGFCIIFR